MENFALQIGPCSSLILRISPWGIPSVFLLSSTLSWRLPSFYFPHRQHLSLLSLSLVYPLLHPARAPGEPRRRTVPRGAPAQGGRRPGSGRARPQAARLAVAARSARGTGGGAAQAVARLRRGARAAGRLCGCSSAGGPEADVAQVDRAGVHGGGVGSARAGTGGLSWRTVVSRAGTAWAWH
jgi:hypothetical protein